MPVPASITWLKEAAKSLEPSLAAAEQVLSREQLNRIEEFLRDRHPHEKSVAVFAGRNAWQFVPLQVAVNNDLRWGAPAVSQLLWLVDEHRPHCIVVVDRTDRKSTRLNSSHSQISYAVFCLKKKKNMSVHSAR